MDNSAFLNSVTSAADEIVNRLVSNTETACLLIENSAKRKCPVDTGVNRASITHQVSIENGQIVGMIGSNQEIAPYIHNGTGIYAKDGNGRKTPWGYMVHAGKYRGFHFTNGQKPKPFLEDAKKESKGQIERILCR